VQECSKGGKSGNKKQLDMGGRVRRDRVGGGEGGLQKARKGYDLTGLAGEKVAGTTQEKTTKKAPPPEGTAARKEEGPSTSTGPDDEKPTPCMHPSQKTEKRCE